MLSYMYSLIMNSNSILKFRPELVARHVFQRLPFGNLSHISFNRFCPICSLFFCKVVYHTAVILFTRMR